MIPVLLMLLICSPLIYYMALRLDKRQREKWNQKYPAYTPTPSLHLFQTKLADIKYHCNKDDIGIAVCIVRKNEKKQDGLDDAPLSSSTSDYMVIRDDGKQIGVLPKRMAGKYTEFSNDDTCTAFGMVQYDKKSNKLWCDLNVFQPDAGNETVTKEIQTYIQWVQRVYGIEYVPERYNEKQTSL